jgi:formate hydrogenlyase transcriptional activator
LLDINNAVVTQLELGNLLHATCDCLHKVIPHDAASICLYDPETRQLRLHSFNLKYASDLEEGALFPLEGSPQGRAFTSHQPVLISHLDLKEFPAPQIRHAYNDGLRSGCIIPLVAHDRTLGTLDIASRSESAFTEEDVTLLTHIAKQIAIAVENALAYREISYAHPDDRIFASTKSKGSKPFHPDMMMVKRIRPAALRADITRRIG